MIELGEGSWAKQFGQVLIEFCVVRLELGFSWSDQRCFGGISSGAHLILI